MANKYTLKTIFKVLAKNYGVILNKNLIFSIIFKYVLNIHKKSMKHNNIISY